MKRAPIVLAVALLSSSPWSRLAAQTSIDDRARAVVAYRAMDYERSLAMLRPYLERHGASLRAEERAELLGYIAASEHWLGHAESAQANFRAALRASVRFRPDTLDFPLAVLVVFERARASTDYFEAALLEDAAFVQGRGAARFRVLASAPQRLRVTLCDGAGVRWRTLYDGPISDSLTVRWDGRVDSEIPSGVRRVALCAGTNDAPVRAVLALEVTVERRIIATGTTPPPASAPAKPMTWLAPLAGAVVVAALPSMVSDGEPGTPARFGVSAALIAVALRDATRGRAPLSAPAPNSAETTIAIRAVPAAIAGAPDAH